MERRTGNRLVKVRLNLLGVGLAVAIMLVLGLGASVIASVSVATRAYTWQAERDREQNQYISVKGYARERIVADRATWQIEAVGTGYTLGDAFQSVSKSTESIEVMLLGRGFAAEELELGAISTQITFKLDDQGNLTNTAESYTLRRMVTVRTSDVERVRAASVELTDLLGQGVRVVAGPPGYTIADAEPIKIRLIGAATDNARERAARIADGAGGALGVVRSAHRVCSRSRPPQARACRPMASTTRPRSTKTSAS